MNKVEELKLEIGDKFYERLSKNKKSFLFSVVGIEGLLLKPISRFVSKSNWKIKSLKDFEI